MENLEQFKKLGLSDNLLKALKDKGFEVPTPVQETTIPMILDGDGDLICQAQTGTGKTAAFGLPLLHLLEEKAHRVQALILAPTRELAIQISEEINSLKGNKKLHIAPIYGGSSIEAQMFKLKSGLDIVVGTPGRVLDQIRRKSLVVDSVSYLVLDEADEMLKMGFKEELEDILSSVNLNRRTFMFCATMAPDVLAITKKYLRKHQIVTIKTDSLTSNLTDQIYVEVEESSKFEALCRIIDFEPDFYGMVFTRTKVDADNICNRLIDRGYDADTIHGDLSQSVREKVLGKFRNKRIRILIATDVAARGVDVQNISHVVNYSLPQGSEAYVHRVGRTGRAGSEGTAITFVTRRESRSLIQIRRDSKTEIRKGTIPGIDEIIKNKKETIKTKLLELSEQKPEKIFRTLAKEILDELDPELALITLLKHAFSQELDVSSYKEIKESKPVISEETRLFIAKGAKDGMTKKSIVEFIKLKAKTHDKKINSVEVFDTYSFITVPFSEAEFILRAFRSDKPGKRPIVEKAADKKYDDTRVESKNRDRFKPEFSERPRKRKSY
ncbi:MAG: DEAD/DEAH box helicase [Candidatus Kapabacteria bacterium]|nr:DEAD/DEAH box helicase [Candidatus Kapabacteria bacterium]